VRNNGVVLHDGKNAARKQTILELQTSTKSDTAKAKLAMPLRQMPVVVELRFVNFYRWHEITLKWPSIG
jgi:hypothetical protein